MLDEGDVESICVTVKGSTERPIDDIVVNGMLCVLPQNTLMAFFHCAVKVIIGDDSDYNITGCPLMFGEEASSVNTIQDQRLCFDFTVVQDSTKEEEEKFKVYLSTTDPGIKLCRDQGHISIREVPADGMSDLLFC